MIRIAGPDDIDLVMAVMIEAFDPAFGEAWNKAQCLGIIGLPGVWLMIDEEDGTCRGFALSRSMLDEAELLLIAVRPDRRGHGVGARLLEAVIEEAALRGAAKLHLEVRDGNDAIRLYAKGGFTQVGRRKDYYSGQTGERFDALTLMRPTRD